MISKRLFRGIDWKLQGKVQEFSGNVQNRLRHSQIFRAQED